MATKRSKALLYQKTAAGALIALIAALLIYLSTLVLSDMPIGGYEEGTHYQLVENPRRIRGEKVEIMEFFSYGCPHCFDLENYLAGWKEDNGERINFVRSPVIFNESWRGFAQTYYTAEALGIADEIHIDLFEEVQRKRNPMMSVAELAGIFATKGVEESAFRREFNSPGVKRQVELAEARQRRFMIPSVPTIIVNGRYRVSTSASVGLSRLLDVVDHLIEQESDLREAPASD